MIATAKNGLTFDSYDSFEIVRIAVDEEVRALREEHLDEQGIDAFAEAHPEFYHCEENSQALQERLAEYGDGENLPCTRRNLELVHAELLAEGRIKSAPPAPAKADAGNPSITLTSSGGGSTSGIWQLSGVIWLPTGSATINNKTAIEDSGQIIVNSWNDQSGYHQNPAVSYNGSFAPAQNEMLMLTE